MTSARLRRVPSPAPAAAHAPALPLPEAKSLIRVQMAKRNVRSVRALHALLEPYDRAHDLRLSLMQLHRLVKGTAKQINVKGLCALCAVLECNIADLYDVTKERL